MFGTASSSSGRSGPGESAGAAQQRTEGGGPMRQTGIAVVVHHVIGDGRSAVQLIRWMPRRAPSSAASSSVVAARAGDAGIRSARGNAERPLCPSAPDSDVPTRVPAGHRPGPETRSSRVVSAGPSHQVFSGLRNGRAASMRRPDSSDSPFTMRSPSRRAGRLVRRSQGSATSGLNR